MPHPPRGPNVLRRFELLLFSDQLAAVDARRTVVQRGTRRPPSRSEVIRALIDRALDLDHACEADGSSSPDRSH